MDAVLEAAAVSPSLEVLAEVHHGAPALGVALLQVLLCLAKQLDAELRSCLVSGVQAGLEGTKNEDDIDVLVALVCRQEKIDHFLEDFVL